SVSSSSPPSRLSGRSAAPLLTSPAPVSITPSCLASGPKPMPDLKSLPKVFDRALIARHLARRPKDADDFVTRLVLADLDERLGTVTRDFRQALIMSPDASIL